MLLGYYCRWELEGTAKVVASSTPPRTTSCIQERMNTLYYDDNLQILREYIAAAMDEAVDAARRSNP